MLDMREFYDKNDYKMVDIAKMFRVSEATVYRWRCNDPQPPVAVLVVINNWGINEGIMGLVGNAYDHQYNLCKETTSSRIQKDRERRALTRKNEGRPSVNSDLPMSAQEEAKIYETGTVKDIIALEKRKRKPATLPPTVALSNPKGYAADAAAKDEPSFM